MQAVEYATYDTVTNRVWQDEEGKPNSYLAWRAPEQVLRVFREAGTEAWHPVGVGGDSVRELKG